MNSRVCFKTPKYGLFCPEMVASASKILERRQPFLRLFSLNSLISDQKSSISPVLKQTLAPVWFIPAAVSVGNTSGLRRRRQNPGRTLRLFRCRSLHGLDTPSGHSRRKAGSGGYSHSSLLQKSRRFPVPVSGRQPVHTRRQQLDSPPGSRSIGQGHSKAQREESPPEGFPGRQRGLRRDGLTAPGRARGDGRR